MSLPDMPADGKLKAGDRIFKVDGMEFKSSDEFISTVSRKQEGSEITLTFERQDKTMKTSIPLKKLEETGKPGVGITLVDDKEIEVDPAVNINSEEIGGPSAGLMFSLEIYNQLIKEDLTGGYKIAGTGTINSEGTVGRIGGIEQKVVAKRQSGSRYFPCA